MVSETFFYFITDELAEALKPMVTDQFVGAVTPFWAHRALNSPGHHDAAKSDRFDGWHL